MSNNNTMPNNVPQYLNFTRAKKNIINTTPPSNKVVDRLLKKMSIHTTPVMATTIKKYFFSSSAFLIWLSKSLTTMSNVSFANSDG